MCSSYFSANSTELITTITVKTIVIKSILLRNFLLTLSTEPINEGWGAMLPQPKEAEVAYKIREERIYARVASIPRSLIKKTVERRFNESSK
jgi:hypothetical protein